MNDNRDRLVAAQAKLIDLLEKMIKARSGDTGGTCYAIKTLSEAIMACGTDRPIIGKISENGKAH